MSVKLSFEIHFSTRFFTTPMVRVVNKMVGGTASVEKRILDNHCEHGEEEKSHSVASAARAPPLLAYSGGSYVSNKRNERAPDGDMCAECKVLHAPFRAKMDWNGFRGDARTPDGTKDIKEVSDNSNSSSMYFPAQVTEVRMGWNIKGRLWIANTAEFTKLCATPMGNRLCALVHRAVRKLEKYSEQFGPSSWAPQGSGCPR